MIEEALGPVLLVVLGVPLAGLAWQLSKNARGGSAGFVIRGRGGERVEVRGRLPRSKTSEIQDFCRRHLGQVGVFTVRGSWGPGRVLQLRWTGHLTPGERQRV